MKGEKKMLFIDENTISTIREYNGRFVLTFYKNCKPVFVKDYATFKNAKIAESKLMKKYYYGNEE